MTTWNATQRLPGAQGKGLQMCKPGSLPVWSQGETAGFGTLGLPGRELRPIFTECALSQAVATAGLARALHSQRQQLTETRRNGRELATDTWQVLQARGAASETEWALDARLAGPSSPCWPFVTGSAQTARCAMPVQILSEPGLWGKLTGQ